ncbi:unnamed protein product [Adineta steineri]|uniref:Uncharacterized protein n=1 Tax=Adineta steineri TaxID=433720 RepID=A0A818UI04_9BILA|nr:unnamed protein product [Adineta steineri]CAF3698856.1 unnamed protein product [Adineta steineri]
MSSDETVGLGVRAPERINAPFERVWAVMVDKVYNTSKYLPVQDVKTEDRSPTHVYREMAMCSQPDKIMKEDIYLDKDSGTIRFAVIGADEIHINKFHKNADEQVLEYWMENSKGERIPWNAPKSFVLKAMKVTKDLAEKETE